jgi:hypothetical protein
MSRDLKAQVVTLQRFITELRGEQEHRPHLRYQLDGVIEQLERQTAALQRKMQQAEQEAA